MLVWRSPIHKAFVAQQTDLKLNFSLSTLIKMDLFDRVKGLEQALREQRIREKWKEGLEDALAISAQTNSVELIPLLEMALHGKDRESMLKNVEQLASTTKQDWIRVLCKEVNLHQTAIDNVLIESVISRAKHFLT